MSQPIVLAFIALGSIWACVVLVLVVAWKWRSRERVILFGAGVLNCILFVLGLFALVGANAEEARLTVRNGSPWPIMVSALNVRPQTIFSGQSEEFYIDGGPGWINGLIDDVEIVGGPSFSTYLSIEGLEQGESYEITITSRSLEAVGGVDDVEAD